MRIYTGISGSDYIGSHFLSAKAAAVVLLSAAVPSVTKSRIQLMQYVN